MVATKFISEERLRAGLASGLTKSAMAERMGVSRSAITQAVDRMKIASTAVVISNPKNTKQLTRSGLKAAEQLTKINTKANQLLDEAMRAIKGPGKPLLFGTDEEVNPGDPVSPVELSAARGIALKACAEIRAQLALHLEISKTLYSIEESDTFRQTVLEVLEEIDPSVRNEIVKRLRQKRQLRSAIEGV